MVGEEGLEPSSLTATDFKSVVYTNSTTLPWRRVPESHRCSGFCRPVPNSSANAPYIDILYLLVFNL